MNADFSRSRKIAVRIALLVAVNVGTFLVPKGECQAAGRFAKIVTPASYLWRVSVPNGQTISVETADLSGVDTVASLHHVGGAHLVTNDDCVGLASCLSYVNASGATQDYMVIVRPFAWLDQTTTTLTTSGTARVTIKLNGTTVQNSSHTIGGYFRLASLTDHSDAFTTPVARGVNHAYQFDTIMQAFNVNNQFGVSADDDSGGTPLHSWLMFGAGQTSTAIFVGGYFNEAWTNLIVSDNYSTDTDGDGLDAALEAALGTCNATANCPGKSPTDSDGDGISDGLEVIGTPALPFSQWGADPALPDFFVEADWDLCTNPLVCGDPNSAQMTEADAVRVAEIFGGKTLLTGTPKVAVHADIGRPTTYPTGNPMLEIWGDWGGATGRDASVGCTTRTADRIGYFHFPLIGTGNGGSGGTGAACASSMRNGAVIAHELGHTLSFAHSGQPGSKQVNGKPIYPSVMNYLYQNNANAKFSAATFMGVSFNPRSMDETNWRNGNVTASMTFLQDAGLPVSGNQVDWNMDGAYSSAGQTVRGMAGFRHNAGRLRDWGWQEQTEVGFRTQTDPTLTWWGSPSGGRFYTIARSESDNRLMFRVSTDIETACSASSTREAYEAPCGTFTSPAQLPTSTGAAGPPVKGGAGATDFLSSAGTRKLMVAYTAASDSKLYFQVASRGSSGGSPDTWTDPVLVDATKVVGDHVALAFDAPTGRVEAYATCGTFTPTTLCRWSFNAATNTWDINGVTQTWADTSLLAPVSGVGLTAGYLKGEANPRLFIALPMGASTNVKIGYRSTTANVWTVLDQPLFKSDGRLGLAYQPFNNSVVNRGKFWMLGKTATAVYDFTLPQIFSTAGNDVASGGVERSIFFYWGNYYNDYDKVKSATLAYNPTFDTNVRGATHVGGGFWFQPIADGAVNTSISDQNDYDMLLKNLRCGFDTTTCRECTLLNADGTCATWQPLSGANSSD